MKTIFLRSEDVVRRTHLVDAKGKVLGRLATTVATLLRGKSRVDFTPHVDGGDAVVVINSDHVRVTGNKVEQKIYKHYTGYPGGLKEYSFEHLIKKDSREIIRRSVKGMLPKNSIGRHMLTRLRVFKDEKHTHAAQKPEPFVW